MQLLLNKSFKYEECSDKQHRQRVNFSSLQKLTQAFLREEMMAASYENGHLMFLLPVSGRTLYIETNKVWSLGRYTSFGRIFLKETAGDVHEITNPLELLDICVSEFKEESARWVKLSHEITDHLRNALLTSYKSCNLDKSIYDESKSKGFGTLVQWLENHHEIKDAVLFFEQWASRGHPYHPCSKTKLGFTVEEVVKYSPEFHPTVGINVLAVRQDHLHAEAMDNDQSYSEWFAAEYPATWQQWVKALENKSLLVSDFLPLPAHPWQVEKKIPELFAQLIRDGIIHILEGVAIPTSPTLSFRTLAPTEDTSAAYIKLPVAVQATSVFRTLSRAATVTSPKVSSLLKIIFEKENDFGGRLSILHELFGLHIKKTHDKKGEHLTAIFRENPVPKLSEGEVCVVIAALFESSPVTGLSLFIELMHLAGVLKLQDAIDYFHRYVQIVLGSYLDLYLYYGVEMEGHQQNTLAVFRNGHIVRFIARDLEGVNIHEETLKARGFEYKPVPGWSKLWQERHHVRNKHLYTVYQSHLGEVVLLLANHFKCDENLFWHQVKRVTEERFEFMRNKIDEATWQAEYEAILSADWPCKALLRMRLQKNSVPEGLFSKVANPLLCIA